MKTLGVALVALGVLALIYGGIDYNRNRTVVQMGSMEIKASEHHSIPIPAMAGLAVLIGGVAFLVSGARRGGQS
jgi:UDP-N-acetylmuramyl pentapeptide phosphotransferase/UDP-N-acetylglucosamine-1-phosphate transferase